MKIVATPRFSRSVKKLHPGEKAALDEAVRAIMENPQVGEMKKADLVGVRVHKYRVGTHLVLLAYRVAEEGEAIKLLALGSHENFYRDLKRE